MAIKPLNICILSLDETLLTAPSQSDTAFRFNYLLNQGIKMTVLVPTTSKKKQPPSSTFTIIPCYGSNVLKAYLKCYRTLVSVIQEKHINLVVTNNPELGFLALPPCKRRGVKLQVSVFGSRLTNLTWAFERLHHPLLWLTGQLAIKGADTVRVDTSKDKHTLMHYLHIPSSKVAVIPVVPSKTMQQSFIEGKPDPVLKQSLSPTSPLVISIGTLTKNKDFGNLIDAAAIVVKKYPKVTFLIVGSGPEKQYLTLKIEKYKLKMNVTMVPSLPYSSLPSLYHSADLYVCSSSQEGLPRVLMEAALSHCPIVSTDIPGAYDLIDNNKSGLIVSKKNAAALAQAILWHLTHSQESKAMAVLAFTHAQTYLNFHQQTNRLIRSWHVTVSGHSLADL